MHAYLTSLPLGTLATLTVCGIIALVCIIALARLVVDAMDEVSDACGHHFTESDADVRWCPTPEGAYLVEVDTAGQILPPDAVAVHVYEQRGGGIHYLGIRSLSSLGLGALEHEEAAAARRRFFETAARLNLERGRFEATDPATL